MEQDLPGAQPRPRRGEMVAIIQKTVKPVARTERVAFDAACGRVCAADVFSRNTLPNTPVSRFDGIAVRYADFENGPPDTSRWREGAEYAYCNTGIALPAGYDTVIAIEDVTIHAAGITVHEQPEYRGEMVNAVGENLRTGERLAARGTVLSPAHIGLLAAGGVLQVDVFAKPRVGVIPTGDELVPPGAALPTGKNVDSNSYMIAAYLAGFGAEPTCYPIVPDRPDAIRSALEQALCENDAAAIIAGSSLGTRDYTVKVLGELGRVVVPELAHGPGRKSSLSVVGGKPVLGVAGPPLGAQITCDLYLAPFVGALRGLPHAALQTLQVTSDDAFETYEVDFCERVHIYKGADGYRIRSAFARRPTRAQMQALANGNYYRPAGSVCGAGGTTEVELLCPVEYVPDRDLSDEILAEEARTRG